MIIISTIYYYIHTIYYLLVLNIAHDKHSDWKENWKRNSIGCWRCVAGSCPRPVVILGPFSQALIQKLVNESPDKYMAYEEEFLNTENTVIEKGIAGGVFVDYKKVNDLFKVTRTETLHKIANAVS